MTTTATGLDGRTVVVTGAAGGQGLAAALLLDEAGARVIATDIADAAPALDGTRVVYRRLDVADEEAWRVAGRRARLRTRRRAAAGSRQQRGHHPSHAPRQDGARGLGSRARREPDRADARHPGARAADGRAVVDRQHRLVGRAERALSGRLHVQQVGSAGAHARRGDRARAARHPGQHRASGIHRDADDGERTRRDARGAAGTHSARALRQPRRGRAGGRLPAVGCRGLRDRRGDPRRRRVDVVGGREVHGRPDRRGS